MCSYVPKISISHSVLALTVNKAPPLSKSLVDKREPPETRILGLRKTAPPVRLSI